MPICGYRSIRALGARAVLGLSLCLGSSPLAAADDIFVPAGGDLQAALNAAKPGDTVSLQAGATFAGNFVLPVKPDADVITVRSSAGDAQLPGDGVRIDPAHASLLPKLHSPNTAPALRTAKGAHHWRLLFLEFGANKDGVGTIIALGDGSSAQSSLAAVASDIVVDRCYVHGDRAVGQKRGIGLNSARTHILNSYIADIKAVGQDSQAIAGWNGPGPFDITNNFIEAAGENVLFGGADPYIPGLVPADITIERNHMSKPVAWRGSPWQVKNLFELKNAERVVIRDNVFERNWQAAQAGYAIVFSTRNQDGRAPWSRVQQVRFEQNIVRDVAAGISIHGTDDVHPSGQTRDLRIAHNVFVISKALWGGSGHFVQMGDGPADIAIDHNTVVHDGTVVNVYGNGPWTIPGFVFTNNIARHNTYGIKGVGFASGTATIGAYFPGAVVTHNVLAGGRAGSYPAGNWFPAAAEIASLLDGVTQGNYESGASNAYRNAATDGLDVGAVLGSTVTAPPPTVTAPPPTMTAETAYTLAEGATGTFFNLDICLANPNPQDARARIWFMKSTGETVPYDLTIPALARRTVRVNDVPAVANAAVSTVVESLDGLPLLVERSMFWDRASYGGHTEAAVAAPGTVWYFAEGSQGFFDTFLLLVNSGDAPAEVDVTFLLERGGPLTRHYTVLPRARFTIATDQIAELAGTAFSVRIISSRPIVAERAMYFGLAWEGGHESAGVAAPATTWFHAEGATGPFFDTFLLIGNPNVSPVNVTVQYLLETGATIVRSHIVAAESRLTIDVEREDPQLASAAVSATVTANLPILSERAMYWPGVAGSWTEGHNSFGVTRTSLRWGVAEGRVGGTNGFETFLLLANPNSAPATVRLTFMRTNGTPITRDLTIGPTSRLNVHVNTAMPELANESFGVLVESLNNVSTVVEETMYWTAGGRVWAGGSNAAAIPLP
jgi:hypothetical protein